MADESAATLAVRIFQFSAMTSIDPGYAAKHPGEAGGAMAAAILLVVMLPELSKLGQSEVAQKVHLLATKSMFGVEIPAGELKETQECMKLMGEILSKASKSPSSVSGARKARYDSSMTFARNSRA